MTKSTTVNPSRVNVLAQQIQTHAETLDKYLNENDLPPLSFDTSTAVELPAELHPAQTALLEAADELSLLVQGPRRSLMTLGGYDYNATVSLKAIIHFNIASSFPLSATASFASIAEKCNLPILDTISILRYAMTYRIFHEPSPNVVAHTASSRLLAQNPDLCGWIAFPLGPLLQATTGLVEAIEKWPNSQEPNEAGFNIATKTNEPMFKVLAKQEKTMKDVAMAMKWWDKHPGMHPRYVVEGFDWKNITHIVDVGGSFGTTSIQIAKTFPDINVTVQDLPEVVAEARKRIEIEAENLKSRVRFMEHDFFAEQPVRGADVYFFRWILHDWSDLYAVRILRALIPALKAGAWIVINELLLPGYTGSMSLYKQRLPRSMNLTMKAIQNGRERSTEDWHALVEMADPRFRICEMKQLDGAHLGLIIVKWDGES